MKVRCLEAITPAPGTLAAAGISKDVVVFEGVISDYRFAPDIVTINGQQAFRLSYNVRENNETIAVYRQAHSHNIVVTTPTTSTPKEVSDEH